MEVDKSGALFGIPTAEEIKKQAGSWMGIGLKTLLKNVSQVAVAWIYSTTLCSCILAW